jgi:hypothetical protein
MRAQSRIKEETHRIVRSLCALQTSHGFIAISYLCQFELNRLHTEALLTIYTESPNLSSGSRLSLGNLKAPSHPLSFPHVHVIHPSFRIY